MVDDLDLPLLVPPRPCVIGLGAHGPGILRYRIADLWQLHVYAYSGTTVLDGRTFALKPGVATLTPPGAAMVYEVSGIGTYCYVHFAAAAAAGAGTVRAPRCVDLGRQGPALDAALRAAIPWQARRPERAACRVWDVLWAVVEAGTREVRPDLVDQTRDSIEKRLGGTLRVSQLARDAGCSPEHLVRAFRARLGTSVLGYIRARRAQRAAYLLRTTDLPLAHIAREIGVADPHAFNKLVRRELGDAPSRLR
jgi:AraC family transcriptional regulator